uniref:DUF38 domain-containing protein n=1 Tax=Panagrolaimus davidi TaxID=227884 RepID=A0A914QBZ2_9BILA
MTIPKELYDQCCPEYQKLIKELEEKNAYSTRHNYNHDDPSKESTEIILKFSDNYLTPNKYWEQCVNTIVVLEPKPVGWEKRYHKVLAIARKHFYFHKRINEDFFSEIDNHSKMLIVYEEDLDESGQYYSIDEDDLSYPHNCLKKCFHHFEKYSLRLPPTNVIKKYEQMKTLYTKIKAVEKDADKWIKCLKEFGNDTFLLNNVENRLGKNLMDINLWKTYMAFLKEDGKNQRLLETYSKYCRFFLDDKEMKEVYKSEMIKYGPVKLQWKNLFDFEICGDCGESNPEKDFDGNEKSDKDESMDEDVESDTDCDMKDIEQIDKNLYSTFYDKFHIQSFHFRESLIHCILKNANHRLLRKLFFSCKYFFFKQPTPICYRLKMDSEECFEDESIVVKPSSNLKIFFNDTYITGSIEINKSKEPVNKFISNLIPCLYRCEAKYINLVYQNLSFEELKFLIQHGGVIELNLSTSKIIDENDDYIFLEEITAFLPNIEKLRLERIKINANTAHVLATQKFNSKINDLFIDKICGEPFDSDQFLNYLIVCKQRSAYWAEYVYVF